MRTKSEEQKILGILGGVGPRASAEFLKTIYEYSGGGREQDLPRVLLYSDPSFPDRTETLLAGNGDDLLRQLTAALNSLRLHGVSRIVICCVTIHHLLPRLPRDIRAQVTSLVDVVMDQVSASQKRHLLVCTRGARSLQLFERHPQWNQAKDYLLWPDETDQESIHQLIYRIKRNEEVEKLIPVVETLLEKYGVGSFVAGCTELHVLAKQSHWANGSYGCLDPLTIIAAELAEKGI